MSDSDILLEKMKFDLMKFDELSNEIKTKDAKSLETIAASIKDDSENITKMVTSGKFTIDENVRNSLLTALGKVLKTAQSMNHIGKLQGALLFMLNEIKREVEKLPKKVEKADFDSLHG